MSRKYKMLNPEGVYFISFATINWIDIFVRQQYFEIIDEKKGQSMWNYYFRNDICSCNGLVRATSSHQRGESDKYNDSSIDEENKVRIEIKDYKLRDYAMEHDVCEDCEY